MIYSDGIHMIADTLEELHAFANSVGLSRSYFHGTRKGHPHYDLIGKWKNIISVYNIKIVSSREIINILKG